jgi:hypothetical protein
VAAPLRRAATTSAPRSRPTRSTRSGTVPGRRELTFVPLVCRDAPSAAPHSGAGTPRIAGVSRSGASRVRTGDLLLAKSAASSALGRASLLIRALPRVSSVGRSAGCCGGLRWTASICASTEPRDPAIARPGIDANVVRRAAGWRSWSLCCRRHRCRAARSDRGEFRSRPSVRSPSASRSPASRPPPYLTARVVRCAIGRDVPRRRRPGRDDG